MKTSHGGVSQGTATASTSDCKAVRNDSFSIQDYAALGSMFVSACALLFTLWQARRTIAREEALYVRTQFDKYCLPEVQRAFEGFVEPARELVRSLRSGTGHFIPVDLYSRAAESMGVLCRTLEASCRTALLPIQCDPLPKQISDAIFEIEDSFALAIQDCTSDRLLDEKVIGELDRLVVDSRSQCIGLALRHAARVLGNPALGRAR